MWQFTIWWRWSAMLASNCNNIILKNKKKKQKKKGCSLCCFLPRKSLRIYGHVRRCQEGAWRRKQQDKKGQGDCVVGSQDLSVTVRSKPVFADQIVTVLPSEFYVNQFFRFGLISIKHSFQWNFGICCRSCERQHSRCTQGALLFTWPTALAWEAVHALWLHGLDCGSVAFNVLSKLHRVVSNKNFPYFPVLTGKHKVKLINRIKESEAVTYAYMRELPCCVYYYINTWIALRKVQERHLFAVIH